MPYSNRRVNFVQCFHSSLVEVEVLCSNEKNNQVTRDESGEDAKVSPSVAKVVTKGLEELIANLVCAVLASISCVVDNVTGRTAREKVAHICTAVLSRRSIESIEFGRCACDLEVMEFGHNHASNKTREGVELVEPHAPELGNLGLGNCDTAEQGKDDLVTVSSLLWVQIRT